MFPYTIGTTLRQLRDISKWEHSPHFKEISPGMCLKLTEPQLSISSTHFWRSWLSRARPQQVPTFCRVPAAAQPSHRQALGHPRVSELAPFANIPISW